MSELSGLELRKAACEALGFHFEELKDDSGPVPNRLYVVRPDGSRYGSYNADFYRDGFNRTQFYPAIESDPVVSESMFLELCNKHSWDWLVGTSVHGPLERGIFAAAITDTYSEGNPIIGKAEGRTPSEARARAIVAAMEKQ